MTNQKLPMFKDSIYVVCSLAVSMEMKPWPAWEDIFVDCWGPLSLTLGIHCCGLLGSTFTGGPLLWIVGVHFHWGSTVVDCWGPLSLGVQTPLLWIVGVHFHWGSSVVDCWGPLSLGVQTPLLWIVGVHFHWGSRLHCCGLLGSTFIGGPGEHTTHCPHWLSLTHSCFLFSG